MIAPAPACPDCSAPLPGTGSCSSCGLPLLGPLAARLWQVDQQLLGLDHQRDALRAERTQLIARLRTGEPPVVPAGPTPQREASPKQVQNTLLGLGALLLALAGIVFAAVTYRHLGVVGRAGVLIGLTVLAAAVPLRLAGRGLTASAEAVAVVALVLGALDAWALRRAGLGAGLQVDTYGALATGLLAALAAGYALVVPLRAPRVAALVLAQLPVPYLLARFDTGAAVAGLVLALLGALDLMAATDKRPGKLLRTALSSLAGLVLLASFASSVVAISDHERAGAYGLLALSLVAAGAAYRVAERKASLLLSGAVAPLAAAGAWALVRDQLTGAQQPVAVIAVALVALQVCSLLPRDRRSGPVLGSLAVAVVALLTQTQSVLLALAGPFSWLAHPWTLTHTPARLALSADLSWKGSAATVVVLLAAVGCALAAGALLDELVIAAVPAAALLVLSALVLPLGLALTYHQALVLLVAVGGAQAIGGALVRSKHGGPGMLLVAAGSATAVLAAVWSTAEQDATLATLPVVGLLAAALSYRLPGVLTGATALLAGAELAAVGAGQDLAPEQVGGLLLVAPAVCVGLSFLLRGAHRLGLEGAAGVLAATTVALAVEDPGWLSWTIAADGLLCLALAIRPDRRALGLAGGLLLSASSWVRLADADVRAPEAYVAPLAVAALLFGHLRRRADPRTGSFAAYGAGLSIALVPSLLKALDDPTPTRGLILLVVAGAVVVLGGRERLRAPLVIGGGVLALDALHLVAPYASALPRWTLLAGAGTLLVALGATYEQRLRDVARLRTSYDSWT